MLIGSSNECRHSGKLAKANCFPELDARITFDADSHVYHVDGKKVAQSVTNVLKSVMDESVFDANLVIANNLASWQSKPTSKYGKIIAGLGDQEAREKLTTLWANTSVLGTRLHLRLESFLNDTTLADDGVTDVEWELLVKKLVFMAHELHWTPVRTELSVFYERAAPPNSDAEFSVPCAGQIDCLFHDEDGELIVVDLKRTDRVLADIPAFGEKLCKRPLQHEWANDF